MAPVDPSPPPDTLPKAPLRVLVIDDDAVIARSLKRILKGLEVTIAPTGEAGVEAARGESFALIFCDLSLPGKTGMEVHAAIEAQDPAQAARMVFVTGGAQTAAAQSFVAEPSREVLHKPFTIEDVRGVVERHTAHRF